jgi:murein DD-endopeptidase MepM/ murein hydrolase activator NlpD
MGSDRAVVNIWASLFLNIILLTSLLMPFRAQASTTCYFFFFCTEDVQAEEAQISNSQNMALLQAAISPNQNSSSTDGEITIVGGTSLLPDTQKPADTKNVNEDQISMYVVRKGDTLPAIAKMFGVSVNTVRWGNDIKDSTISVGQTLVILPISGIQHTVKSGDTLQSIANKYKGSLDEILQYNNLSKNAKLAVGDIIVVPDGEVASVSTGSSSGVGTKAPSYPVYSGYYMRPLVGGIKTQGLHDKYAVDFASAYGTNILASAEGDVLIARGSGYNGGYGSYIVLKHPNGTQTLYGHLSAVLVNPGDHVEQGQVIGKMGNTGRVNGPTGIHLHFEVRGARNPF